MKKYLLLLTATVLFLNIYTRSVAQVCTPGTDTSKLFSPDTLSTAIAGQLYQQVVYVHVPHDTTVTFFGIPILVYFDSVQLVSVTGLPQGFSYGCNPNRCVIKGDSNGCLALSGTATEAQAGDYVLNVKILAYLFDGISFHFSDTLAVDSLYILKVRLATGITFPDGKSFAISNAFPNPAEDELSVYINTSKPLSFDWVISDVAGRKLMSGHRTEPGTNHTTSFDISNLDQGQYLLQFENDDGNITRTFFKR